MEDVLVLVLDPEKQSNYTDWDFFYILMPNPNQHCPRVPNPLDWASGNDAAKAYVHERHQP